MSFDFIGIGSSENISIDQHDYPLPIEYNLIENLRSDILKYGRISLLQGKQKDLDENVKKQKQNQIPTEVNLINSDNAKDFKTFKLDQITSVSENKQFFDSIDIEKVQKWSDQKLRQLNRKIKKQKISIFYLKQMIPMIKSSQQNGEKINSGEIDHNSSKLNQSVNTNQKKIKIKGGKFLNLQQQKIKSAQQQGILGQQDFDEEHNISRIKEESNLIKKVLKK